MSKIMRLDRFVSNQVYEVSRSEVKLLCKKGKISVNGKNARPDDKIDAEKDEIFLDGKKIEYKEHIYIMLNKPKGYVCSTKDGASPTVLELVPKELYREGLFPAGRLDKDTEGLVLITDDGELSHKMLSPKNHVDKKYYVELERDIREDTARLFEEGITIDGNEKCLPAKLERIDGEARKCYLILNEGKYHQVKRMFGAVGNKVTYLKRISIGKIFLDENLPVGNCLEILHKYLPQFLDII
ncbi:MAG: rRNA pseudouridine synthase [Ruminococcus sp.]|nr:rRNA pseudouridine synthase [Ruminococcus sp.]